MKVNELKEKTKIAIEYFLLETFQGDEIDIEKVFETWSLEDLKVAVGDRHVIIMNDTDGFSASIESFSILDAIEFMEKFANRYKAQGHYTTSMREQIPIDSVSFSLVEDEFYDPDDVEE